MTKNPDRNKTKNKASAQGRNRRTKNISQADNEKMHDNNNDLEDKIMENQVNKDMFEIDVDEIMINDGNTEGMPEAEMETEILSNEIVTISEDEISLGMPQPDMGEMEGAVTSGNEERVLVELKVPRETARFAELQIAQSINVPSLNVDPDYDPVEMGQSGADQALALGEKSVIVRATIDPARIADLEADPRVIKVWKDGRLEPFADLTEETKAFRIQGPPGGPAPALNLMEGMAACPIGTCDCDSLTPKGTIADVASYLGVDKIWSAGHEGDGIVVGVVDGGIRANGRPIKQGEAGSRIDRVIGGWPTADWGTTAAAWGDHGNMCATDVLGMAPNCKLYDLRISDGSAVSEALQAFQWAIDQHKADGTPHILTNSWGMFQLSWDPDYCTNPNHPFTRKVVEAIGEGILVLFAAGNCGGTCPSWKCGADTGPGKSIWGANGHPQVITVGAVNKNEQFVGYSSQGPAALDSNKPDFCSVTHFTGYFVSDSGTSAATPIAAGVVALLKQAVPELTQNEAKAVLKSTAKDIGPAGFDQHSGAGIINAKAAYDELPKKVPAALEVFVRSKNGRALWHKWQTSSNGNGWSDWSPLRGWIDMLAVGQNEDGRLEAFARAKGRALWHKWQTTPNGDDWSNWVSLGGWIDMLAVGQNADGRLEAFARARNRALYHKWQTNPNSSGWSDWSSLGGWIDMLAVGQNEDGRIEVFARGSNGALYHKWQTAPNGNAWSNWVSLGGNIDLLAVGQNADGRLEAFARGPNGALYHKWQTAPNGSAWSKWVSLGGWIDMLAVGQNEDGRLEAFARGSNGALYHKWQTAPNGSGWSDWVSLGGWIDMLAVGQNADGRLEAFVRGPGGAVSHKWQTALNSDSWSNWASLAGQIDMLAVGQNTR